MLDDKRLAEIRERAERADNARWIEAIGLSAQIIRNDVPALLVEVERLRADNEKLAKCRHECKIVCLLAEYEKLHTENSRLRTIAENAQTCYVTEMAAHSRTKLEMEGEKDG